MGLSMGVALEDGEVNWGTGYGLSSVVRGGCSMERSIGGGIEILFFG